MITLISEKQPQYRANLHCHSTLSDGKLTPEELKEAYKNEGYSILSITDHEIPHSHNDLSDPDFLMLTGYEAYIRPNPKGKYNQFDKEVHLNLFARDPDNETYIMYNDSYCKYIKDPAIREGFVKAGSQRTREYTVDYINEFIHTARENGYLVAHNHAIWSFEDLNDVVAYEGLFSMEMCNYSSYVTNRLEYNGQLYDRFLRKGYRLGCHSTDDNHNGAPFGHPGCDSFGGYTMVLADHLTYPAVMDALEQKSFYSSMGPRIYQLTVDKGTVHVKTTGAKQIMLFYGSKKVLSLFGTEEHPVTEGDFTLPANAMYFRISVYDFQGRYADTRGYFPDELGDEWPVAE